MQSNDLNDEAYAFISLTTNMPYVECEEVDYNDRFICLHVKKMQKACRKNWKQKVTVSGFWS